MGRKFKDMETPEQRYLAATAEVRVGQLGKAAHAADQEAQRQQMTADIYGREGKDYTDRPKAERAAREARKHRERADRLYGEARKVEAAANPKPQKRRWF
ncbi:hypothetical protein [Streptomyces sp. BA2]|uniref:hypothetical protein n=1 Tax=Streptomyces sp. BA2 TaxID=436595 RepID=UPI001326B056|nr:hypothetical protein [Streptomyces sp. BA2]MWA08787.1 hypothetical protein [Streptomyces sp. BA2]